MKNTKYVFNNGLAFSEESDMKKLQKYAKNGWVFEKICFGGFLYKLRKGEQQEIEYALDYQQDADEEYFTLFESSGWSLVYSDYGIHIFSAPKGTKPIYSDHETTVVKYEQEKTTFGKHFAWCFTVSAILFLVYLFSSGVFEIVAASIWILSLIPVVFTGMPYAAHSFRLRKLSKKPLN